MAIIKKNELKNISKSEIESKLNDLKIELMKEKNERGGKSLKIKEIRKTIAKLLTFQKKFNVEKNKILKESNKK